jgi:uncharacterized protein YchJ
MQASDQAGSISCPCGSGDELALCCGHYHAGTPAPSAERLMRSRYSAYVLGLIDYLKATTLPVQQAALDLESMRQWSANSIWLGLEIEQSTVLGACTGELYRALARQRRGPRSSRALGVRTAQWPLVLHRSDGSAEGRPQRPLPLRERGEIQEVLRALYLKTKRAAVAARCVHPSRRYFSTNARSIR